MSAVLLFLAGAAAGGAVGWVIALRLSREAQASSVVPPVPEEMLASDTATHLAANMSADSTFEPLAHLLIERCSVQVRLPCALVMRERVGAAAHISAVGGGLDSRLLGIEVPLDSPAGRAITDGIPVVGAPDEKVVSIDRRDRRRYSGGGVAVPLAQGGHVYGAVVAFGDPPAGTHATVDSLATEVRKFTPVLVPAYQAAVAARRAETDELTGLANRRAFSGLVNRSNAGDRVAMIVFDIDHFKDVNDSLGHPAGDAALRHVSRLVRQALRPKDTAARIGGEEFAVIMHYLKATQYRPEIFQRIQRTLSQRPIQTSAGEIPITASIGVRP